LKAFWDAVDVLSSLLGILCECDEQWHSPPPSVDRTPLPTKKGTPIPFFTRKQVRKRLQQAIRQVGQEQLSRR
jgi:hypothetical protein